MPRSLEIHNWFTFLSYLDPKIHTFTMLCMKMTYYRGQWTLADLRGQTEIIELNSSTTKENDKNNSKTQWFEWVTLIWLVVWKYYRVRLLLTEISGQIRVTHYWHQCTGSGCVGFDFFGPDLSSKCKCVLMYVINIVHLGN